MSEQAFKLKPFPTVGPKPDIEIRGYIVRSSNWLKISYELHGALSEIIVQPASEIISRKNGLWEETCFEFFLRAKNSTAYLEFNLSPSGHWNIYRFESYRQGMQEESAISSLPFSVTHTPEVLKISLDLDLQNIFPSDRPLKAAVSAVIQSIDATTTYWAPTHPGPKADFHLPDCFILCL